MLDPVDCTKARSWLRNALQEQFALPSDARFISHFATCPVCRGALLLVMTDLLAVPVDVTAITCDVCAHDLPALVDEEVTVGLVAAARAYPHVWFHLWTCTECAATYDFTRTAITLSSSNVAAAVPQRPLQRLPILRLTRHLLNYALPLPSPLLGVARGDTNGPFVISERSLLEGRSLRLSVEEQANQQWRLIVEVVPPSRGWLITQLGDQLFRTDFDAQGCAIVNIPAALLSDIHGPDLTLEVELEE